MSMKWAYRQLPIICQVVAYAANQGVVVCGRRQDGLPEGLCIN